jgi:hypothetical protein
MGPGRVRNVHLQDSYQPGISASGPPRAETPSAKTALGRALLPPCRACRREPFRVRKGHGDAWSKACSSQRLRKLTRPIVADAEAFRRRFGFVWSPLRQGQLLRLLNDARRVNK